jgi:hypothetical protein
MARTCRSTIFAWPIESFDCSKRSGAPSNFEVPGLATFQGGRTPNGACPALWLAIDGVRTTQYFHTEGARITLVCDGLDTGPVDCLNGYCVPASTYNTPGVFANLAACQSGCAQNSTCTGECVSAEELAALQQAANNLRARLCG